MLICCRARAVSQAEVGVLRVLILCNDLSFFFFQAEDGIRDLTVTGVQTCALPIFHYRRVAPSRRGAVRELVTRVLRGVPGLALIAGREVFDFVPRVRWSKGEAARWIVHRAGRTLPRGSRVVLYAGDDATDEAAFAALKGRALTVRVGNGPSAANYRVRDVREMQAVLRRLAVALG